MKFVFFSIFIVQLFSTSCFSPTQEKSAASTNDSAVYKLFNEHQILLTNLGEFDGHTSLYGASAFLVEYKDKIYAATAKHLIGESGGVLPEINPNELSVAIKSWKMFPRVPVDKATDTVIVGKEKINYKRLDKDILFLPIEKTNYNVLPLKPTFSIPKKGDVLYMVGCPYAEDDCKQNIYEVDFNVYYPDEASLIFTMREEVDISGFSGAPLLDKNGNVLGVVIGTTVTDGVKFVYAIFIREIRRIE